MIYAVLTTICLATICTVAHFWQYKCRGCKTRGRVHKTWYGYGPNSGWWLVCWRCDFRWVPRRWAKRHYEKYVVLKKGH